MAKAAARELEQEQGVVFPGGLFVMDEASPPGHHLFDAVLFAEEVAGRGDAMAAEIVHGPAAGAFHIPEMGAMRAAVRLARADPQDATDSAGGDHLLGLDDARREDFGFGVAWSLPEAWAACSINFASAALRPKGFVQTWFRPALAKARETGKWESLGRAMMKRSISIRAMSRSRSAVGSAMFQRAANEAAFSRSRE